VLVEAEVAVHVVGAGGDDVPGGAALADMVERGELARQQEGVFIGGGCGRHKADMLRHDRQGRPQGHRFEVGHPALAAEGLVVAVEGHARAVGHEHLVEQAALGGLRHLDVVVDVDAESTCEPGWRQAAIWWPVAMMNAPRRSLR
jgi:hypothetical protein